MHKTPPTYFIACSKKAAKAPVTVTASRKGKQFLPESIPAVVTAATVSPGQSAMLRLLLIAGLAPLVFFVYRFGSACLAKSGTLRLYVYTASGKSKVVSASKSITLYNGTFNNRL